MSRFIATQPPIVVASVTTPDSSSRGTVLQVAGHHSTLTMDVCLPYITLELNLNSTDAALQQAHFLSHVFTRQPNVYMFKILLYARGKQLMDVENPRWKNLLSHKALPSFRQSVTRDIVLQLQ